MLDVPLPDAVGHIRDVKMTEPDVRAPRGNLESGRHERVPVFNVFKLLDRTRQSIARLSQPLELLARAFEFRNRFTHGRSLERKLGIKRVVVGGEDLGILELEVAHIRAFKDDGRTLWRGPRLHRRIRHTHDVVVVVVVENFTARHEFAGLESVLGERSVRTLALLAAWEGETTAANLSRQRPPLPLATCSHQKWQPLRERGRGWPLPARVRGRESDSGIPKSSASQENPRVMSSTPAKRASEAAAKLQAFLQSADLAAIVTKPKQVAVADAAIATSLIFDVLARIVPVQGFDAAARIQFDTLHVVGGAVLWGRVASLATRVATLKHAEADTDKHAVVDAATWPTLFDDDVYFGALAIDMTPQNVDRWDAAAEATHFARGVRAFFSGALTSGDVFVADLTRVRRGFLPQAEGGEAAFAAVAARFAFDFRRCESQPQPPAIMKIELDKSQEDAATAVVREHLHAHLFAASAWLDAAGIERRNPPRPPKRPRGDEMAAVDVDDVASRGNPVACTQLRRALRQRQVRNRS